MPNEQIIFLALLVGAAHKLTIADISKFCGMAESAIAKAIGRLSPEQEEILHTASKGHNHDGTN